jgi:hypothetical protein
VRSGREPGRTVELCRYRIPAGERALKAQRVDGRVAVMDVPVDYDDRVYLVKRHIQSVAELDGLAAESAQRSQDLGQPTILATHSGPATSPPDLPTRAPLGSRRVGRP